MTLAQTQPDTATAVLFYLFALMAGGAGVAVVVSRNIVRTAVALLFTLAGVAGLYFLLDAEFLAAVQLVIYVGGTLILIVFGVMLTSKSPFSRFEPKRGEVVLAAAMAVVLLAALVMAIPVSETAEKVAAPRLGRAVASLPDPLREKVRYDAGRLRFSGPVSATEKETLLAAIDAEYGEDATSERDAAANAVESLTRRSQRFFFADRPLPAADGYPVGRLGREIARRVTCAVRVGQRPAAGRHDRRGLPRQRPPPGGGRRFDRGGERDQPSSHAARERAMSRPWPEGEGAA